MKFDIDGWYWVKVFGEWEMAQWSFAEWYVLKHDREMPYTAITEVGPKIEPPHD